MGAAGIGMGSTAFSAKSYASILGANERVNVAVIGIHGMGQNHIGGYSGLKDTRVTALCDVDSNLFNERIKKHFTDKMLPVPQTYTDLRKIYENKKEQNQSTKLVPKKHIVTFACKFTTNKKKRGPCR